MSLLLDPKVRHWDNSLTSTLSTSAPSLPELSSLTSTIAAFKDNSRMSKLEKLNSVLGNRKSLMNGLKFVDTISHHHCSAKF